MQGSNDCCATVPVLPSPSNGSRLTGTVHLVASASSIVSPIPHRTVPRLSRSLPSSSSSDSPYSFTPHASIVTAITGCWLPMPSSGIRSSRSGMSRVGWRSLALGTARRRPGPPYVLALGFPHRAYLRLRIPLQVDHPFRLKWATYSRASGPGIPGMWACHSDRCGPPLGEHEGDAG